MSSQILVLGPQDPILSKPTPPHPSVSFPPSPTPPDLPHGRSARPPHGTVAAAYAGDPAHYGRRLPYPELPMPPPDATRTGAQIQLAMAAASPSPSSPPWLPPLISRARPPRSREPGLGTRSTLRRTRWRRRRSPRRCDEHDVDLARRLRVSPGGSAFPAAPTRSQGGRQRGARETLRSRLPLRRAP